MPIVITPNKVVHTSSVTLMTSRRAKAWVIGLSILGGSIGIACFVIRRVYWNDQTWLDWFYLFGLVVPAVWLPCWFLRPGTERWTFADGSATFVYFASPGIPMQYKRYPMPTKVDDMIAANSVELRFGTFPRDEVEFLDCASLDEANQLADAIRALSQLRPNGRSGT